MKSPDNGGDSGRPPMLMSMALFVAGFLFDVSEGIVHSFRRKRPS